MRRHIWKPLRVGIAIGSPREAATSLSVITQVARTVKIATKCGAGSQWCKREFGRVPLEFLQAASYFSSERRGHLRENCRKFRDDRAKRTHNSGTLERERDSVSRRIRHRRAKRVCWWVSDYFPRININDPIKLTDRTNGRFVGWKMTKTNTHHQRNGQWTDGRTDGRTTGRRKRQRVRVPKNFHASLLS